MFFNKQLRDALLDTAMRFFLLFLCLCFQFFGLTLGFLFGCLLLILFLLILFFLLSFFSLFLCRSGRAGLVLSLFPLRFLFACGLLLLFLCLLVLRVKVHSGGQEMDTKKIQQGSGGIKEMVDSKSLYMLL